MHCEQVLWVHTRLRFKGHYWDTDLPTKVCILLSGRLLPGLREPNNVAIHFICISILSIIISPASICPRPRFQPCCPVTVLESGRICFSSEWFYVSRLEALVFCHASCQIRHIIAVSLCCFQRNFCVWGWHGAAMLSKIQSHAAVCLQTVANPTQLSPSLQFPDHSPMCHLSF